MNETQKIAISITIPAALLAVITTWFTLNVNPTADPDGGPPADPVVADAGGEGEGEGEVPPPPPPPPAGHPRPATSKGTGFFVDAGKLYDANGQEFRIQGIATTLWWGHQERNRLSVPELAKAGANSTRLVFGPGMGEDTAAEQRTIIQQAVASQLIPIVTDMGATCKTDLPSFEAVVARWLEPARVAYLKEFEKHVILNIANEALGFDGPQWRDAYVSAITRLRQAGVHATIMVDSGGACGQNPRTVRDFGAAVLAGDPERNTIFSVHMYAYWRTSEATDVGRWNDQGTQSPWRIRDELGAIQARGLHVSVGEVGWEASDQVAYLTKAALQDFAALGVGYIAWSWNQNSDSTLDLLNYASPTNYLYRTQDLSPAGALFILDPQVGLLATAKKASVF